MHLLVCLHRVRPPARAALGIWDVDSGAYRTVLELPGGAARCDGLTAAAVADGVLWVGAAPFRHLGEAEPSLIAFRRRDLMPETRYRLRGFDAIRALFALDGTLYVASTADGAVVAFPTVGPSLVDDRFTYRHAGAQIWPTAMNRLGNDLIAAAVDARGGGLLLNVTRDAVLARGLDDPRALAVADDRVVVATPRTGTISGLSGTYAPTAAARLDGIGGGLCLLEDRLYAGSTGGLGGRIHRLRPHDLEIEATTPIAVEGSEIACLLPVEGAGAWPSPPESHWQTFGGEPF